MGASEAAADTQEVFLQGQLLFWALCGGSDHKSYAFQDLLSLPESEAVLSPAWCLALWINSLSIFF